ncbi:MAG: cytochrome c oxidase assembly protein [Acidimicrobiia bacterium]
MSLLLAAGSGDAWRWVPHPEVWVLVVGMVGLYVYAARVIGPKAVPGDERPVSRQQLAWFVIGMALLWVAADWPVHDIGEKYLYLVHMSQHLVLTLVMPPALLLATPEWLARLILGRGRVDRWVHQMARPIPATVLFNGLVLLSHWQSVVNLSSENGLFHYGMHTALVLSAFLLWIPVCGPLPELRIPLPAQMIHLFVTSIIPTVPGAWLVLADGAVYSAYDIPTRLFDISVTQDQQAAGLIMKLVGGSWLWLLITIIFFRWAARHAEADRAGVAPSERDVLTWEQVRQELERHPAPVERPVPDS